jgi:hypothetical protein
MRFIFYKTTCNINGKFYYGVHLQRRASDGYIGCGVCSEGSAKALKRKGIKSAFIDSVIKHGYKNFSMEIVKEFESIEDAYAYEAEIVTESLIKDPMCLNVKIGGIGGVNLNSCKGISILDIYSGDSFDFKSQADCASFLNLKNISGKIRLCDNRYIVKGNEIPVSLKRVGEDTIHFHDIMAAYEFTKIKPYRISQLIEGKRKSSNGWFLGDFDFNSSYYKNAKSIRNKII